MGDTSKYLLLTGMSLALAFWTFFGMGKFKEKRLENHMQVVEQRSELWYNNRYKGYVKVCSGNKQKKTITCSVSEKKFFIKEKKNYRIIGEVDDYDKPIEYIANYKCNYEACMSLNIE